MQAKLKDLYEDISGWYMQNARALPWRMTRDPYAIWISEIMLQQTRAAAVIGYWSRFIAALPDVFALASAEETELAKLWQGLGYYSRARNLQRAAREIVDRFGGRIPSTAEELSALPGFGPYTSAAVAAFAFGRPEPCVDGNVMRLYARLYGINDDILRQSTRERVRELVRADLCGDPALFGQALIELGACVCTPRSPKCNACPLKEVCTARGEERCESLPVRGRKKPRRIEKRTVLVIRTPKGFCLRQRPERGLLAGLYEFPGTADTQDAARFARALGLEGVPEPLCEYVHVFTHVEWHVKACIMTAKQAPQGFFEATLQQIDERYAVPSAFAPILLQLSDIR